MTQAISSPSIEQQAKRGEALLEHRNGQQRASNAQFIAAMAVLLLACGLAFGAMADDAPQITSELSADEKAERVSKSSRFCIFGVDDLKLRPSAARGENEKRNPAHFENGDCWMDKPGQMA